MKFSIRFFLVLSIPILVLFSLTFALWDWAFNHAEFQGGWALVAVYAAFTILVLMALPQRGRPSFVHRSFDYIVQAVLTRWPYANLLPRNMWDHRYGARPLQPGEASGAESTKSKRTFGSTIGGHVAHLTVGLKQIVSQGIGGQPRLMLERSRA